ncbi:MAG: hypothetical protein AAGD10_13855 [Myxococcota bacterium]
MTRRPRQDRAGLTLIEITIALGVAALIMGLGVVSVNALSDRNLRTGAMQLTGAIKYSYDRSIMQNRIQRLGMNIDTGEWWLDYTDGEFSVRRERAEGSKGAMLDENGRIVQVGEEELRDELRLDDEIDGELRQALEGGLGARFEREEGDEEPRKLPGSVKFSRVWTGHQEEPFEEGIAFIHFFDGGWTEPALIELVDGDDDYVTLTVAPLTGRVRTKHERMKDPQVDDFDGFDEGDL